MYDMYKSVWRLYICLAWFKTYLEWYCIIHFKGTASISGTTWMCLLVRIWEIWWEYNSERFVHQAPARAYALSTCGPLLCSSRIVRGSAVRTALHLTALSLPHTSAWQRSFSKVDNCIPGRHLAAYYWFMANRMNCSWMYKNMLKRPFLSAKIAARQMTGFCHWQLPLACQLCF